MGIILSTHDPYELFERELFNHLSLQQLNNEYIEIVKALKDMSIEYVTNNDYVDLIGKISMYPDDLKGAMIEVRKEFRKRIQNVDMVLLQKDNLVHLIAKLWRYEEDMPEDINPKQSHKVFREQAAKESKKYEEVQLIAYVNTNFLEKYKKPILSIIYSEVGKLPVNPEGFVHSESYSKNQVFVTATGEELFKFNNCSSQRNKLEQWDAVHRIFQTAEGIYQSIIDELKNKFKITNFGCYTLAIKEKLKEEYKHMQVTNEDDGPPLL